MRLLASVRSVKEPRSIQRELLVTAAILVLGCCMGVFSKYLDFRQAELPPLLQRIEDAVDLHNYLSEFAPWLFIAVCTAVFSRTPVRAAVNVFLFFAGMCLCYFLYSRYAAGFFPRSYALLWAGLTVLSPLLASLCWYAGGQGAVALFLSAGILGFFLCFAFDFGLFYVSVRSWLSVVLLVLIAVILRKTPKGTALMLGLSVLIALLIRAFLPIGI